MNHPAVSDIATSSPVRGIARQVLAVVLGTALLALSAKVQVPFWPVPMTLQSGMVLVLGVAYGWRLGGLTVLAYLAEGALGLPVFAGTPEKGIGLAYMAGPTGGYLVGFVVSAVIAGWAAERRPRTLALAGWLALASLPPFLLGAGWLAQFVGAAKAVSLGVVPFLPGALVKGGLALALAHTPLRLVAKRP